MIAEIAPLRRFLDGLLGAAAGDAPVERERHRDLLATCLASGLLGAVAFPAWLVAGAPGGLFGALTFFWVLAPVAIASYLTRTGRLRIAEGLATTAIVGLIAWIAAMTGGLASPILVWLAAAPVFAAGWLRGGPLWRGVAPVAVALGLLAMLDSTGIGAFIPQWRAPAWLGAICVLAALASVAVRARRLLALSPSGSRRAPAEPYRLLADYAADLVTRHDEGGKVEYASPAAERLLSVAPADLAGDGLFALVQVADRPRFLTAVSDALHDGTETSVEYRLRRKGSDGRADDHVWVESRFRPIAPSDG